MNEYDLLKAAANIASKKVEASDSQRGEVLAEIVPGLYRVRLLGTTKTVEASSGTPVSAGDNCAVRFFKPNTWVIFATYANARTNNVPPSLPPNALELSPPSNFRAAPGIGGAALWMWDVPVQQVVAFEVFSVTGLDATGTTGVDPYLTTRGNIGLIPTNIPLYARVRSVALSGVERSSWSDWIEAEPSTGSGNLLRSVLAEFLGTLDVGVSPIRVFNLSGVERTITKVHLTAGTGPTGQDVIVDVHKNGTTLFTDQSHRPRIVDSAVTGETTTIDVDSWADGEYLDIHLDQVGSGAIGSNLTVQVVFSG